MTKKLRYYRELKGKSMRELSQDLGVNYSLISRWENGNREPRSKNKEKLERYFNVPFIELMQDYEKDDLFD
nr:transcriptional regulator [Staphylococcus phage S-CoN_Ph38]